MFKIEGEAGGFKGLARDLANVDALKTLFDPYHCINP